MAIKNMNSKSEIKGIEREIRIHFTLDSPYVVKLYDCFIENNVVYMILEWAENGNLYSYMYRKRKLDQREIFQFFYQTCRAVKYIHDLNIIHRDLKVIIQGRPVRYKSLEESKKTNVLIDSLRKYPLQRKNHIVESPLQ